jgi:hypothetical protein
VSTVRRSGRVLSGSRWTAVESLSLRALDDRKALHASSRNTSPRSAGRAGRELPAASALSAAAPAAGKTVLAGVASLLVFAALTVQLDEKWPESSVNCPELGVFAGRLSH